MTDTPSVHVGAFHTTRWSLVARLSDPASEQEAAADLARAYWPAIYSFFRSRGMDPDGAGDATQGFFADVVLGRSLFHGADRTQGRLRAWILASLKNYTVDLARRKAVRRTFDLLRADVADVLIEDDPARAFDKAWAAAVVKEATRRCERHFESGGKRPHWSAFEARVLQPSLAQTHPRERRVLADELGFAGAPDVAAAGQVVRKRLVAILAEVVAETVAGDAADADAELRHVRALLA